MNQPDHQCRNMPASHVLILFSMLLHIITRRARGDLQLLLAGMRKTARGDLQLLLTGMLKTACGDLQLLLTGMRKIALDLAGTTAMTRLKG